MTQLVTFVTKIFHISKASDFTLKIFMGKLWITIIVNFVLEFIIVTIVPRHLNILEFYTNI